MTGRAGWGSGISSTGSAGLGGEMGLPCCGGAEDRFFDLDE